MRARTNDMKTRLAAVAAATLLTLGGACGRWDPPSGGPPSPQEPAAERAVVDIFAFGRVLGTIAPCGCTTEPLGGLNYAFGYIDQRSRAQDRLVIEPGSFLFPDPTGPEAPTDEAEWAQAGERAGLLQKRFAAVGDHLVSGIGPTDLTAPDKAEALRRFPLPRTLANVADHAPLGTAPYRLVSVAGGKIAVTTIVDPTLPGADALPGLQAPEEALTREIAAARAAGADLVVVQMIARRPQVEALVGAVAGIDVAVVGQVEKGERARVGSPAAKVGETWILEPGEQAQTISHLRLSIDRKTHANGIPRAASWTAVPTRAARESELARVEARLTKFREDPAADPTFIRNLEGERDALKLALDGDGEASAPVSATFDQVKVTCKLPSDDAAAEALRAYDAWVAEQNRARFEGVVPPAPAAGEASYVGMDECESCHDEAMTFWRDTRHAGAFKTLHDDNKQYDLSCVGCHVTGFRKPGGSEVVENAHLQAVQCEQCHGPGSRHVEEPEVGGKANAIRREAPIEVCMECHTPEHSDTFDYNAYLRDIVGPGHGEGARLALGKGPTGRELRQAGFDKAGGACKKKM